MKWLDKLRGIHIHIWKKYTITSKCKKTIFYCRECKCGIQQIQQNGPMGNRSWRDATSKWTFTWEQERFNTGTRNEY